MHERANPSCHDQVNTIATATLKKPCEFTTAKPISLIWIKVVVADFHVERINLSTGMGEAYMVELMTITTLSFFLFYTRFELSHCFC